MATAVDARVAVPEDRTPSARPLEAVATLLSCVGLLIQVIGYAWGWHGDEATAIGLWYVGFVGIVVPFAWLLLAPSRTGHQRLGAALAFGLIMYASWFLTNPIMSTRFDETLHVTTLVDMVDQHSFFIPNSTLPVSPHYPGLEFATAGVHWLTGLPLIVCQVLVVVTARSTFILALFLLASRIGRSTQVGAATVLLYAGSAQFYFFNAQFSYQTVAIAMLMAALYLLVRAFDSEEERPWRLLIAVQVCLGGLAITHHLTSWLMLVLLWLLALFFWRGGEERRARLTLITAELGHGGGPGVDRDHRAAADQLPRADLRRGQQPAADRAGRQWCPRGRHRRRRHAHSHLGADGDGRLDPALDGDAGPGRLAGLAARQPRADQGALHPAGHRR